MSEESIVRRVVNQETSRRNRTRDRSAICYEYHDHDESEDVRVRVDPSIDPSDDLSDSAFIQRYEPDARAYEDALPELSLPGSGELLEDCGEEIPALFCRDCGTPYEIGRTCRRSRCPRCWQSWAFNRAKSLASKVEALGRHLYTQENKTNIKQHHVTVSLRDSTRFNSQDPLGRGFEVVKSLLATVDVETGVVVYHPYRIAKEYRGDVLGHESGDGDLTWKDVLEKVEGDSWTWDAVRDEFLVYAPHFHVICLSEFVDCTGVGDLEDETGVVIHRITTKRDDGNKKSIAGIEELGKVTAYSLSHAGIAPENDGERHRAAVRPFGRVANFEAWGSTDDPGTPIYDTDKALRKVAPKVLGIEFPEAECTEHVHERDDEDDNPPLPSTARTLGTGGSGSGFPSSGSRSDDELLADAWTDASAGFASDDRDSWTDSTGVVPPSISEPPAEQKAPCSGKLAPMWAAGSYLGNLEWITAIQERYSDGDGRLRDLRDAYERWDDMGRPHPVGVGDDDLEDGADPPD